MAEAESYIESLSEDAQYLDEAFREERARGYKEATQDMGNGDD